MKRDYIYLAVMAILFIVLGTRECSRPTPPESKTIQANKDKIALLEDSARNLLAKAQALLDSVAQDTVNHKEAQKADKQRIQTLEKKLAVAVNKKPEIRRDTVFLLQDSIINEQAAQIETAHKDYDKLNTDYTALLKVKDAEIRVKSEINDHLTAINQELYKSLNKERKKKRLWKVAVGAAAVVGFVIGSEL